MIAIMFDVAVREEERNTETAPAVSRGPSARRIRALSFRLPDGSQTDAITLHSAHLYATRRSRDGTVRSETRENARRSNR